MPEWSETNPLRVVTGYHNIARKFFAGAGFEHVVLLSADGALEAAPLMGTADIILDLVCAGGGLPCLSRASPAARFLRGAGMLHAHSARSAACARLGYAFCPLRGTLCPRARVAAQDVDG